MTSSGAGAAPAQHSWWSLRRLYSLGGEIALTVGLATVGFLVGLGGVRTRLPNPLIGGDMVMEYVETALAARNGYYGGTWFGYPLGMELRYFPTTDHLQTSLAVAVTSMTGNPFLGVNLVWALSFPAAALAGLWLMRIIGLRGPLAVLGALAVTFTPFHWERTYHAWLATSWSALLGVCLALYIGSGQWHAALAGERRRRSIALIGAVCVVIGTSGTYYSVFAIMLTAVAVVWRWGRGASWRALLADAVPVAGVVTVLGVALLPAWWFLHTTPAFAEVARRYPWESIEYSGILAYVLLPSPASSLPGLAQLSQAVINGAQLGPTSGVKSTSDFGTVLTTTALLLGLVGTAWLARRARRSSMAADDPAVVSEGEVGPGLVGALLAAAGLFFVPWGLNYLFAVTVTPQLRGWDRLVPVLLGLFVALGAVTVRRLGWGRRQGAAVLVVALVGLLVLAVDGVWPYRAGIAAASAAAQAEQAAAAAYADELNAAIPARCAVLQLPYVAYPEVGPVEGLGAYDHAWPALLNPEKSWSFGASKGTFDSAWAAALPGELGASDVADLAAGGFCAVHVDLRGYTEADGEATMASLTQLLGPPVASGRGGDWQAFAVPGWSGPITEEDLDGLPDDEQDFYSPLTVVSSEGFVAPEPGPGSGGSGGDDTWWLTSPTGRLSLRTGDSDSTFDSVTMSVATGTCASRDVTVTVTAGGTDTQATAHVAAGSEGRVTVDLNAEVSAAEVVVESDGPRCVVAGTSALLAVGTPTRVP